MIRKIDFFSSFFYTFYTFGNPATLPEMVGTIFTQPQYIANPFITLN